MMVLVKVPLPVPSVVFESEMVGLAVVLQQTPRAIMDAPPSEVIFPPLVAVVVEMELNAVVVTKGAVGVVG